MFLAYRAIEQAKNLLELIGDETDNGQASWEFAKADKYYGRLKRAIGDLSHSMTTDTLFGMVCTGQATAVDIGQMKIHSVVAKCDQVASDIDEVQLRLERLHEKHGFLLENKSSDSD